MRVIVKPKKNASLRTKNRIKENGPEFDIKKTGTPQCLNSANALLVDSVETDWCGWLPVTEITLE